MVNRPGGRASAVVTLGLHEMTHHGGCRDRGSRRGPDRSEAASLQIGGTSRAGGGPNFRDGFRRARVPASERYLHAAAYEIESSLDRRLPACEQPVELPVIDKRAESNRQDLVDPGRNLQNDLM